MPGRIRTYRVYYEGFQVLSTACSFLPSQAWPGARHLFRSAATARIGASRPASAPIRQRGRLLLSPSNRRHALQLAALQLQALDDSHPFAEQGLNRDRGLPLLEDGRGGEVVHHVDVVAHVVVEDEIRQELAREHEAPRVVDVADAALDLADLGLGQLPVLVFGSGRLRNGRDRLRLRRFFLGSSVIGELYKINRSDALPCEPPNTARSAA